MSASQGANSPQEREEQRSLAEWVTLVVSVVILVITLGAVIYLYLARGDRPALIEVRPRLEAVRQAGEHFYVPVEIANRGDLTIENVTVEVSLTTRDGQAQTARFQLPFLAGGASEEGVAAFRDDPRTGRLTTGVVSYLTP